MREALDPVSWRALLEASLSQPTRLTWKANLFANPSCRLRRIDSSFGKQALTGQHKHGLATIIASGRSAKALFESDAAFQSDAMKVYSEHQNTDYLLWGSSKQQLPV
jgi:hypothetical protein